MRPGDDDMDTLCIGPQERARKAYARVLQALQEPGRQVALASTLGCSESTISRLKTEKTEDVLAMIYSLGFKVVAQESVCIDPESLKFMRQTTARVLADQEAAKKLWESAE